jgi:hypothetical protein
MTRKIDKAPGQLFTPASGHAAHVEDEREGSLVPISSVADIIYT